jgi:hydroxylamine reductase
MTTTSGGAVLPPAVGATMMIASSSPWSSSTRTFSTAPAKNTVSKPDMFCRQCEQTQDHTACITVGVCGKTAECAAMQDALVHVIKCVSLWCVAAREAGGLDNNLDVILKEANVWTVEAAFSTLTNVNFIEDRIADYMREGLVIQEKLKQALKGKEGLVRNADIANLDVISKNSTVEEFETFGESVSIPLRQATMGSDDCFSLNEIGTYGLKGTCAYAAHAYQITGELDTDVMKSIHEAWAKLASPEPDMGGLLENALNIGAINAKVMAMLDGAHAEKLGMPEPTQVLMTATEGKCILISGHDMVDLEALLKQTEGTGINVYTHGEMLPAHSYPGLKKYPHLIGNYGTAWQNQKFEFASFPGPVIVTTNCVVAPRKAYKSRLYTMNETGVQGAQHIGKDRDFSAVIAQAKEMKGFPRTVAPASYHTVGFNHRVVLPLAGEIIGAVQSGALSRIVLIGGCDGSQFDRR